MTNQVDNVPDTGAQELAVGDRVVIIDKNMTGEVVDVREFDGRKTFVVHTENGRRLVLGQRQLKKTE